jgi:hypothetical protein
MLLRIQSRGSLALVQKCFVSLATPGLQVPLLLMVAASAGLGHTQLAQVSRRDLSLYEPVTQ